MCRLLLVVVASLGIVGCDAETLGYGKSRSRPQGSTAAGIRMSGAQISDLQRRLSYLAVGLGHGAEMYSADH